MPYYKTLDTLETGSLTWRTESDIFGTRLAQILNKPYMAPEVTNGEIVATGNLATQTLTFTAPEDLTIKKLIIFPTNRTSSTSNLPLNDYSSFMAMSRMIIVSGTGPDVGVPIFQGAAPVVMLPFGIRNISFAPNLNVRMADGDVLELDVDGLLTTYYAYSIILTYEKNIDTQVNPKVILGGTSGSLAGGTLGGGSAASATLTVNNLPTDTIFFEKAKFAVADANDLGENVPGTPGGSTDEYNTSLGTRTLIRDDIYDVITSTHSNLDFWSDWTITKAGSFSINFVRDDTGPGGNFDLIYCASSDITITPFSGGSVTPTVIGHTPASTDIIIRDIYGYLITGSLNPSGISAHGTELVGLDVNGVSIPIGAGQLPPNPARPLRKIVSVPASAGHSIDVTFRSPAPTPVYTMIIAERV